MYFGDGGGYTQKAARKRLLSVWGSELMHSGSRTEDGITVCRTDRQTVNRHRKDISSTGPWRHRARTTAPSTSRLLGWLLQATVRVCRGWSPLRALTGI